MAQAVQELFPEVKVTIGPVIENGFYYDFDSPFSFTPEQLDQIDKKMNEILKRDEKVTREDWPIDKAIETFEKMGERFKAEIIRDLAAKGAKEVGIYRQGDKWFDLCKGPHVQSMGQIKAVKVLSLAEPIGAGTKKIRSSSAFTRPPSMTKKNLSSTCTISKKPKKEITVNWAKSSVCFTSIN